MNFTKFKKFDKQNEGTIVRDALFDYGELFGPVEDKVRLLLAAYGNIDELTHNDIIGSDQDPVEKSVELSGNTYISGKLSKFFFRKTIGSYVCDIKQAFRLANNILSVYGRAFLFIFPEGESLLRRDEIIDSLVFWTLIVMEDTWVEELKNMLLTMFSRSSHQEEPAYKTPHTCRVFRGRFGNLTYRLLFSSNRKSLIWRNTVLHGIKKGMPTVSKAFIERALKKHGTLLASDIDLSESSRAEEYESFLETVERVSRIIFSKVEYCEPSLFHKVSQNATVTVSKADYGALGVVMGDPFKQDDLVSMDYHPIYGLREFRTNKYDSNLIDNRTYDHRQTKWSVEIIREPLKVRTITKGEITTNAVWSDIQQQLWKALQKFPCFRLTKGQGVEDEDGLSEPFCLNKDWVYASGDYSSATDSIYKEVMLAATVGIKNQILRQMINDNLSEGLINYDGICDRLGIDRITEVTQKRGQLMGSIFSFPILCLINLCTYVHNITHNSDNDYTDMKNLIFGPVANEWSFKTLIKNVPVLINGDDILFKSPSKRFYDQWMETASLAGFIPSIGKNYYSQDFHIVNSRFFKNGKEPIPYVNMGILCGRKKGEDSSDIVKSLRQKMASLPHQFEDLWKDFTSKDHELRERMCHWALNCRQDIKWSGWNRGTLGLVPQGWLPADDDLRGLLRDRRAISGSQEGRSCETSIEKALFWETRKEKDTKCLKYQLGKQGNVRAKYYTSLMAQFQREDRNNELEQWWSTSITPNLANTRIKESFNKTPFDIFQRREQQRPTEHITIQADYTLMFGDVESDIIVDRWCSRSSEHFYTLKDESY